MVDADVEQHMGALEDAAFEDLEGHQHQQRDHGARQRQREEAGAAGKPDRGHEPDAGSAGETVHGAPLHDDRAAAEEADTGYHLRGHARGVERDALAAEDVVEAVGRDEDEQRGADGDEGMSAEAGRVVAPLALKADRGAEHQRQRQPGDLISKRQIHRQPRRTIRRDGRPAANIAAGRVAGTYGPRRRACLHAEE